MTRSRIRFHNPFHDRRAGDLRGDALAGLVLGVESVPDGLASGLLAGVNPVAGLYGYLVGMVGAACFTSTTFMTVQATGAMAIIVDDVDLAAWPDPPRALFTLSLVTGVIMLLAGVLRLGRLLRFVPRAVMTGFITAVGANIALGQLGTFTGYDAEGANRIVRALNLVLHIWLIDPWTTLVGMATVALIVVLRRTPLDALGLVVAVVLGSALAAVLAEAGASVATVGDVADIPRTLPGPRLPDLGAVFDLLIPATSLAFVGLIQGAGVSAAVPNPDGTFGDASADFVGQGIGNVTAGVFQGMPVGGSMSATSLMVEAGARSRLALLLAGGVMAVVVIGLGGLVSRVAMPALAGLLIFVGVRSIRPTEVMAVARTGLVPRVVMATTLVVTMLLPLQYAVLAGVAMATIIHVARQSGSVTVRRIEVHDDGRLREVDPPAELGAHEIVVLQMYGSLFFANIESFERILPTVTPASTGSVVLLRARGAEDFGATLLAALDRYLERTHQAGSKMMIVTDNPRIRRQLAATGTLTTLGADNLYEADSWLGETTRQAYRDARRWVADRQPDRPAPRPDPDDPDEPDPHR
ncbi:MAG: SulP family inorganic anion transporter [Acidimicrobiales bacterium]